MPMVSPVEMICDKLLKVVIDLRLAQQRFVVPCGDCRYRRLVFHLQCASLSSSGSARLRRRVIFSSKKEYHRKRRTTSRKSEKNLHFKMTNIYDIFYSLLVNQYKCLFTYRKNGPRYRCHHYLHIQDPSLFLNERYWSFVKIQKVEMINTNLL